MLLAKAQGSWSRLLAWVFVLGFCPRLLAWVLGLGSSLLARVAGPSCSPTHLAQGVGPGSCPKLLTYVNGESPRFLVQFLGPGYKPGF